MDTEETVERLGYLIAELEQKVETLQDENNKLIEDMEWDSDWSKEREPAPDDFNLPIPRLEIRAHFREGDYEFKWSYNLVYKHLCDHLLQVPLGMTRVGGGNGPFSSPERIEEPFRESAHIRSEMKELNLPGFIICGDHAVEINPDNRDQKPWNPTST